MVTFLQNNYMIMQFLYNLHKHIIYYNSIIEYPFVIDYIIIDYMINYNQLMENLTEKIPVPAQLSNLKCVGC